jgi:hypothetical protein
MWNKGGWWHLNWGGWACGNGWSGMVELYQIHQTHGLMPFNLVHSGYYTSDQVLTKEEEVKREVLLSSKSVHENKPTK